MKDCNGDYLVWGIENDNLDDHPDLNPNPLCDSCDYVKTCAFRVAFFLENGKDISEEELDGIHTLIQNNEVKRPSKKNLH